MVRKILKFGDPVLKKNCEEIGEFDKELWALLDDMYETMRKHEGIGLAAPQIGVPVRAVVIDLSDPKKHESSHKIELINPVITAIWGKQLEPEGCLSYPKKRGIVRRPKYVRARAYDRFGKLHKYRVKDLLARAFCHEIDHLNGILYSEKVISWTEDEE